MPTKKNSVTTPLDLLQQLSRSLVEHLETACNEAQKDTETLLAKLEKQCEKAQEKLTKARVKLDDAGGAGKSKEKTKARAKLVELEGMLALLQARQGETLSYLSELKRDVEQSLNLAQGVTQVEKAAAQALASRGKQAPSPTAKAPSKASTSATKPTAKATPAKRPTAKATPKVSTVTSGSAGSRAKPGAAEIVTSETPTAAKPSALNAPATGASRSAGSRSKRPSAEQSTPAVGKPAAKKPAARKPIAPRKPAAATNETENQSSPSAN
ncbi:AlgP family protein [Pseudomonas stutzeri]|uniref:AlgP family protein n=1 Tax=Stutzerimonas stutzeri TaxID=316 RepID=UPI00210EBB8D|nr:AlgP family protein [Stutzerimonas stutzeri]MCQ4312502.1 AlgP family protein [Stutzerimonas stutzeri]